MLEWFYIKILFFVDVLNQLWPTVLILLCIITIIFIIVTILIVPNNIRIAILIIWTFFQIHNFLTKYIKINQPSLTPIIQIRQIIKPLQQFLRLSYHIFNIWLFIKHFKILLIINPNLFIINLNQMMNLLAYPFQLFYIYTKSVHLLKNFCYLFVLVEKHLFYLFL